jgi:RNA polymerase sigma-70 factor (ECF subfamily)
LKILDSLENQAEEYYPFHVARADLLQRSNQLEAAIEAYERAVALCGNPAERSHLQRKLAPLIKSVNHVTDRPRTN